MRSLKKVVKTVIGVVLILLGLVVFVLPLSPGSWLLILIGLEFMGLRLVLETRLWQWANARPNGRISRGVRRILCLGPRDAAGRLRCEQASESVR